MIFQSRAKREILSTAQRLAKGAALLAAVNCGGGQAQPGAPAAALPRPPNVLLIVIDTLRRDHLGCYGYERPTTPALDAFAAAGWQFDRATAASSWTEPSTASLLTGLYPARHGCHEYAPLPDDLELLSERLAALGYRTCGLSGNPNASPKFAFDQGFDAFWFEENEKARDYPDVTELVAHAETALRERLADRPDAPPFFLYLHVMNVHGPYVAPAEWRDRFRRPGARDFPFQNELWKELQRKGNVARRADVTPADLLDLTDRYDAAIGWTDHVLGEFLARRAAMGGAEHDLVIVTSDHGEELFDHGGFGHGFTLHREALDVPLLLRLPRALPGVAASGRIAEPVCLVDVAATVIDLVGRTVGATAAEPLRVGDGQSLVPWMAGFEAERDAPIVAQLEREQARAFLVQNWPLRLIETGHDYAGRRDVAELFDLEADPLERRDLLGADPQRARELRAQLAARRSALEAQGRKVEAIDLDARLQAQMEALGYVTSERR